MGGHMMVQALIFTLLCGTALRGVASTYTRRKVITYYVHESYGPPNASVVIIADPNNNPAQQGFGQTFALDDPIKDGAEENSKVIGFATGFGTTSNHAGLSHFSTTHTLNSTTLGVGRLEILALSDLNQPLKPSEVVVAGGTGDFKYYHGFASIEVVYFGIPYLTFKVTATLFQY